MQKTGVGEGAWVPSVVLLCALCPEKKERQEFRRRSGLEAGSCLGVQLSPPFALRFSCEDPNRRRQLAAAAAVLLL